MTETAEREVRVVHRDDHLLVLYKPPGLSTTSPDGRSCLVEVASRLDPSAPHLHASSRLDAEVSGLVTFARTRAAIRALLALRRAGKYERLYVALAMGALPEPTGEWDDAIALDPRDRRLRRAVPKGTSRARDASTRFEVVATTPLGVTLLRLWPRTGRTHQLRAHAAAAGAPLVGDVRYAGPRRVVSDDGRVLTARRVMLHCARVRLPAERPLSAHCFEARLPDDLSALWLGAGGAGEDLEDALR